MGCTIGENIHLRSQRLSDHRGFYSVVCNNGCVSVCGQTIVMIEDFG